jgi:hypothetical protein
MSIARDITGTVSGGANQLFDLISLVTDSKAYAAKVKELQLLIAENQRYVEAVGPAADILALREQASKLNAEAHSKFEEANAFVTATSRQAKEDAEKIVSESKLAADKLLADAKVATKKASDLSKKANDRAAELDAKERELTDLASRLQAKEADLAKALSAAEASKQDAINFKNDIIAKHRSFIEAL